MKRLFAFVFIVTLLATGCASLPAKERATLSLQAVQGQLEVLQDAERRLCNPVAFDADPTKPITECAGPVSQTLGLTTEKHKTFAGHMATAYSAQRRLAIALQAWKVGQPTPPDLSTLEAQIRAALALARTLASNDSQKQLIETGEATLDEILKILNAVRQ